MIAPRDRYPKKKKRPKLTTGQRKAMTAAFIEKMVEDSKPSKPATQERP